MSIIKSYTDIEQSKNLAKILPLETADMHYSKDFDGSWFVDLAKYTSVKIPKYVGNVEEHLLPCWSLASLLSVLPFYIIVNNQRYAFNMGKGLNKDGETYTIKYNIYNTDICIYSTEYYNNPIDACVEMIVKLHELNLLRLWKQKK